MITDPPWIYRISTEHPEDWQINGVSDLEPNIVAWAIQGGCPDDPLEGWALLHGEAGDGTIVPEIGDLSFIANAPVYVDYLLAEVDRLNKLVYIGEHKFDDLTWKAICEETVGENVRLKAALADANERLRPVEPPGYPVPMEVT